MQSSDLITDIHGLVGIIYYSALGSLELLDNVELGVLVGVRFGRPISINWSKHSAFLFSSFCLYSDSVTLLFRATEEGKKGLSACRQISWLITYHSELRDLIIYWSDLLSLDDKFSEISFEASNTSAYIVIRGQTFLPGKVPYKSYI